MAKKKKGGNKVIPIILVILLVLFLGKNVLIKVGAEAGVKAATGLPLSIGQFKVGAFDSKIHIKNFVLENPKEFKDRTMLDIPEVYVDYQVKPIFTGKVHLDEVRFHLKEFIVVQNADGSTNLDSLKAIQSGAQKKDDKPKETKAKKKTEIQLDNLSLKVDKVVLIRYNNAGEAKITEYPIGLDEQHTDIKSIEAVVTMIVLKSLIKTPIAGIIGLDLGPLGDVLGSAGQLMDGVKGQADKAIGDTKGKLKGFLKNLGE